MIGKGSSKCVVHWSLQKFRSSALTTGVLRLQYNQVGQGLAVEVTTLTSDV